METSWIRFNGIAIPEKKMGSIVLQSADWSGDSLRLFDGDVCASNSEDGKKFEIDANMQSGDGFLIWVRQFSEVLRIFESGPTPFFRAPSLEVTHPECPGNGACRCHTGLKICCEGKLIVSSCLGRWRCPRES